MCLKLFCSSLGGIFWQKIERLQASLHQIERGKGGAPNSHVIFVDSAEEGWCMALAYHYSTRSIIARTYIRFIIQEMLWQNNLDTRMVSHLLIKRVKTNLKQVKHVLKATRN